MLCLSNFLPYHVNASMIDNTLFLCQSPPPYPLPPSTAFIHSFIPYPSLPTYRRRHTAHPSHTAEGRACRAAVNVTQGRSSWAGKKSLSPRSDVKMGLHSNQSDTDDFAVHGFGGKAVWVDSIRGFLGSLWPMGLRGRVVRLGEACARLFIHMTRSLPLILKWFSASVFQAYPMR